MNGTILGGNKLYAYDRNKDVLKASMESDLTNIPKECSAGYSPSENTTIELFGTKKLNQVFGAVSKAYTHLGDKKKKRISHLVLQLKKELKHKDDYAVASRKGLNMLQHKPNKSVIK